MQASYAHKHTKSVYKDFIGQFDSLTDADVGWTSYSEEAITARAPQGLSSLCFRDQHCWKMKTLLVFDMYVEEYTVHKVMRQFVLYEESSLPVVHTVPRVVHR
jgi:hypothetical protein